MGATEQLGALQLAYQQESRGRTQPAGVNRATAGGSSLAQGKLAPMASDEAKDAADKSATESTKKTTVTAAKVAAKDAVDKSAEPPQIWANCPKAWAKLTEHQKNHEIFIGDPSNVEALMKEEREKEGTSTFPVSLAGERCAAAGEAVSSVAVTDTEVTSRTDMPTAPSKETLATAMSAEIASGLALPKSEGSRVDVQQNKQTRQSQDQSQNQTLAEEPDSTEPSEVPSDPFEETPASIPGNHDSSDTEPQPTASFNKTPTTAISAKSYGALAAEAREQTGPIDNAFHEEPPGFKEDALNYLHVQRAADDISKVFLPNFRGKLDNLEKPTKNAIDKSVQYASVLQGLVTGYHQLDGTAHAVKHQIYSDAKDNIRDIKQHLRTDD